MKNVSLTLLLLLYTAGANSQTWTAVGPNDLKASDYPAYSYDLTGGEARTALSIAYSDSGNIYVSSMASSQLGNRQFYIRKWNGSEWRDLNSGSLPNPYLSIGLGNRMAVDKNNDAVYYATMDTANGRKVTVLKFDGSQWNPVGTPGFSPGAFRNIVITVDKTGYPWVLFSDSTQGYKFTVMKFDGTAWNTVGPAGFSDTLAVTPTLLFASTNVPYISYHTSYATSAKVKTFNGTSWTSLPDVVIGSSIWNTTMTISPVNDSLYLTVRNYDYNSNTITFKFNGTSWLAVGTPATSSYYSFSPQTVAISSTGELYRCQHLSSLVVQKFNGSSWVNTANSFPNTNEVSPHLVSGPGGHMAVLYNTEHRAAEVFDYDGTAWTPARTRGFYERLPSQLSIKVGAGDSLFAVYSDALYSGKASCKKFDGTSWVYQGAPGFSAGAVKSCSFVIAGNNNIYVAYLDSANQNKATVMKYNNGSWVPVGIPGFTSSAIGEITIAADSGGIPYVAFNYSNGMSVMKYDGINWVYVGQNMTGASINLVFDSNNIAYLSSISNTTRVRKFTGLNWVLLGTTTVGASETFSKLAIDSAGTPWFMSNYYDNNANLRKTVVQKYSGGVWVTCGSTFIRPLADFTIVNNTPYLITAGYYDEPYYGVTVNSFDGNTWDTVGNAKFSLAARNLDILGHGSSLFISFNDGFAINDGFGGFVKKLNLDTSATVILVQPADKSVCTGTNPQFSVAVQSATAYQWQVNTGSTWNNVANGAHYAGATTDTLTVVNVPVGYNGNQYRCIVTGPSTVLTSDPASLAVGNPAQIDASIGVSPGKIICRDQNVAFMANITGGSAVSYQWKLNNANYGGMYPFNTNYLQNGDEITLIATSTAACTFSDTDKVVMTVYPKVSGSLGTYANICTGTPIYFISPDTPAHIDWKLNGQVFLSTDLAWEDTAATVAGTAAAGGGLNQLNNPQGVFVDFNKNIYVADKLNHRVLRFAPGSATGVVVAGGNGLGTAANKLRSPSGVFVDDAGNVYVADAQNNRIQKWAPGASSGVTVAGGNGAGTASNQLNIPVSVFVNKNGTIYISDQGNNRVQRWLKGATSGVTVAGAPSGVSGGAANRLNKPGGIYVDRSSNIYIADILNHRVQKFSPGVNTGTTVAGGNGSGSTSAKLHNPVDVLVIEDGNGYLLVADQLNHRIQEWKEGNSSGTTIAGGNGVGTGNDQFNRPAGLGMDLGGDIYITDQFNSRLQKYKPAYQSKLSMIGAAGTYKAIITTVKGCKDTAWNTIQLNAYNFAAVNTTVVFNQPDNSTINYISDSCQNVAGIIDPAGGNVLWTTSVGLSRPNATQVYNGKPYLRRYYDIIPQSDGSASVILYVQQNDFTNYNSYITSHALPYNLLPANGTDVTGASHITVTHYLGTPASGNTGPGNKYDSSQKELIAPASITKTYLGSFWKLSFPVTNVSGGYFIHSNSFALKENASISSLTIGAGYFTAYPNPASENINVGTSFGAGQLQLLDLTGKVLMHRPIDGNTSLDIRMLPPAMYILRYTNSERTETVRITKQ